MVKTFALLAGLFLLISMPFAESYSKTYVSGGWLEITRTIEEGKASQCPLSLVGVSDACANSGISQAGGSGAASTRVTLSVKNIGSVDRNYVNVGESLSYVPTGADISFSPTPSQFDGRQAVWEIEGLKSGEAMTIRYEFGATVSEAAIERIPDAAAVAAPSTVMIFAPSRVEVNGTLTISLKSLEGRPISGAKIAVDYPDGSRQIVRTDGTGTASIVASRKGSYTYAVDGYNLYQVVSTSAEDRKVEEPEVPATAASALDAGILPGIIGALPIFAGILAAAVVALIAYNFLNSRRAEEEEYAAPPPLAQSKEEQQGMSYSQKFSFGAENENKMADTTRNMVESRKRRMQESETAFSQEHDEMVSEVRKVAREEESIVGAQDFSGAGDSEKTLKNGEMDDELAELERNARIAGEVAQQEKEVENMLAQLEGIRNKLRAGRGGAPDEEEPGPSRKPKPPARSSETAPQRKPPAAKQKARKK